MKISSCRNLAHCGFCVTRHSAVWFGAQPRGTSGAINSAYILSQCPITVSRYVVVSLQAQETRCSVSRPCSDTCEVGTSRLLAVPLTQFTPLCRAQLSRCLLLRSFGLLAPGSWCSEDDPTRMTSSCLACCTMNTICKRRPHPPSCRYVAPVVEGNAENLNEEKVLMDAQHVKFFSHWARLRSLHQRGLNLLGAAPTVTPAWTEPFGRGSDRYPSVDWTLGETESFQSQPCSRSLKEQCQPYHVWHQLLLIRGASVNG